MKVRNGFVTNSSSSSFVVTFDELPKSALQIKELLFGDLSTVTAYSDGVSTDLIAETIFKDMINKEYNPGNEESHWIDYKHLDVWAIAKELEGSDTDDSPNLYLKEEGEYWSSKHDPKYILGKKVNVRENGTSWEYDEINWPLYNKDCREWAYAKAEELYAKFPDSYFFAFEFSDNEGVVGSTMEHGDIFSKLGADRVIKISHH